MTEKYNTCDCVKEDASKLICSIYGEMHMLWCQMDIFYELYEAEQEKREELLQSTAPGFFAIIKATLSESIFMRLSRLMDRKGMHSNKNLSIDRLLESISCKCFLKEKERLQSILCEWSEKKGDEKYLRLKRLRDKAISHNDLKEIERRKQGFIDLGLSKEDYAIAKELANDIWLALLDINTKIKDEHKLQPIYSSLGFRPSMLLKHLCASIHLYNKINMMPEEEYSIEIKLLNESIQNLMGEDSIGRIFSGGSMY